MPGLAQGLQKRAFEGAATRLATRPELALFGTGREVIASPPAPQCSPKQAAGDVAGRQAPRYPAARLTFE